MPRQGVKRSTLFSLSMQWKKSQLLAGTQAQATYAMWYQSFRGTVLISYHFLHNFPGSHACHRLVVCNCIGYTKTNERWVQSRGIHPSERRGSEGHHSLVYRRVFECSCFYRFYQYTGTVCEWLQQSSNCHPAPPVTHTHTYMTPLSGREMSSHYPIKSGKWGSYSSGLSTWKYQFLYAHWSQATLRSVSTLQ